MSCKLKKVTGSSNLTIPVDITMWNFFQSKQHSFVPLLRGNEVLHRTNNKSTDIILPIGSSKSNLHSKAVNIYWLCWEFNIHLTVEWISRDLSGVADELSRIEDSNEYKIERNGTPQLSGPWLLPSVVC